MLGNKAIEMKTIHMWSNDRFGLNLYLYSFIGFLYKLYKFLLDTKLLLLPDIT